MKKGKKEHLHRDRGRQVSLTSQQVKRPASGWQKHDAAVFSLFGRVISFKCQTENVCI